MTHEELNPEAAIIRTFNIKEIPVANSGIAADLLIIICDKSDIFDEILINTLPKADNHCFFLPSSIITNHVQEEEFPFPVFTTLNKHTVEDQQFVIQAITLAIATPGYIGFDFADFRTLIETSKRLFWMRFEQENLSEAELLTGFEKVTAHTSKQVRIAFLIIDKQKPFNLKRFIAIGDMLGNILGDECVLLFATPDFEALKGKCVLIVGV